MRRLEVKLVGTNVELSALHEALAKGVDAGDQEWSALLTPEPIAAAYARISRSDRTIADLRQEARSNVDKARKSNQRIVFDMGHSSIAEHAVFNFDVSGISRLAIEQLEHTRLASYTEQSQRYVVIGHDFILPAELENSDRKTLKYIGLIESLFAAYDTAYRQVLDRRLGGRNPDDVPKAERLEAEGIAREDARYLLPLATAGQLGMTINARSLEGTVRRLKGSRLTEIRQLGGALEVEALRVTPSLIRYTSPSALHCPQDEAVPRIAPSWLNPEAAGVQSSLIWASPGGVELLGQVLWEIQRFEQPPSETLPAGQGGASEPASEGYGPLPRVGKDGSVPKGEELSASFAHRYFSLATAHDPAPRCFELLDMVWEVACSASCYAQLKRHRFATLLPMPYDPDLGVCCPPSIEEAGLAGFFLERLSAAMPLVEELAREGNPAWNYLLTNAHRRRVFVKMNLRELYHFSRLRMDRHAQWEIRELAGMMCRQALAQFPVLCGYLCGKDLFVRLENGRKG